MNDKQKAYLLYLFRICKNANFSEVDANSRAIHRYIACALFCLTEQEQKEVDVFLEDCFK